MFPSYTASATEDSAAESLDFGVCGPLLSSLGSFTLQNRPGHGASLLPRGELLRMTKPLSVPPAAAPQKAASHHKAKTPPGGGCDAPAPGDSDPGDSMGDVPVELEETYRGNALAALPIQLDAPHAARTFLLVRPGGEQQQHLHVSALRPSRAGPALWSLTPLATSSHPHNAAAPSLLHAPILQLQARAGGPGGGGEYVRSACVAARSKSHVDFYTLRGSGVVPDGVDRAPACPHRSISLRGLAWSVHHKFGRNVGQ